jgi:hypothetical protein
MDPVPLARWSNRRGFKRDPYKIVPDGQRFPFTDDPVSRDESVKTLLDKQKRSKGNPATAGIGNVPDIEQTSVKKI